MDCVPPSQQPQTASMHVINKLLDQINKLDKKLDSLLDVPDKIDSMQSSITSVNNKLDLLESRIKRSDERIEMLEKKLTLLESTKNQPCQSPEEVFAELNDRAKRAHNVILYKLPESSGSTESRVRADSKTVKDIIELFPSDVPTLGGFKTARLGKLTNNSPRPLKILFSNAEDAKTFFKSFSSINLANSRPELSAVSVARDRTEKERKHLQCLRTELEDRIKSGEANLTIKYLNGVPVITKMPAKND